MNILRIRNEMRGGKTVFDLPLRVTFYARVSTDKDEQLGSLVNQVEYYTKFIKERKNWTFIPGYVDEGISGTSTKKRDSFNRMIGDAKAGRFDLIITKEISRFSRSTLDSIRYTQELLENDVGVFFQNDNINTLDSDSELRLVIMAGVAQDEVRKLSERIRFGFRQSIRNGRVLGNDRIWGYNKRDCVLTVNEEEAAVVRRIFDLYGNERLGIRRLSQVLYEEGYRSREGNTFNVLTIRHIICNPKYKGWYCANKTQTVDYRTKRKVSLDESEWVMYPDPSIPAIVSEELWDRANALYKERSRNCRRHSSGAEYHNKYSYSGKIVCGEHGTSYHRQVLKSKKGDREVWECKVYREQGKAACRSPQLRSSELDELMAMIWNGLCCDKDAIVDTVTAILRAIPGARDFRHETRRIEESIDTVNRKKDRLLELSLAGAVTVEEFKRRNDGMNAQLTELEGKLDVIKAEEERSGGTAQKLQEIKDAVERALDFSKGIDSALAAAILDKMIVKKGSTRENIELEIRLKFGGPWEASYRRERSSVCFTCLRNTTPRQEIRTTSYPSVPSDS